MARQSEKPDPRILRTRQAFRRALLELLPEQKYEDISIKLIADRAGLNRSTFYLHYQNKEDLLRSEFASLWDEIQEVFPPPSSGMTRASALVAFQKLEEFGPAFRVMLERSGAPYMKERLIDQLRAEARNAGTRLDPEAMLEDFPNGGALAFLTAAYLGLVEWWLEIDCRYPPDRMADLLLRLYRLSPEQALDWISKGEPGFPGEEAS